MLISFKVITGVYAVIRYLILCALLFYSKTSIKSKLQEQQNNLQLIIIAGNYIKYIFPRTKFLANCNPEIFIILRLYT